MGTGKAWTVKPSALQRGILPRLIPCVIARQSVEKAMKKSEVRQRTLIINFRVLPEERDVFEDRCQASGLSKSDYFRKKCLDEAPLRKRKALPVDVELLTRYLGQVGRIGNNLNQVAKGMNQGFLPSANELNETVQDIKELRAVIRKALGYDH